MKDEIHIVNKRMNGMHIIMIVATAGLSIVCQLNLYCYYAVGMGILLLFTSIVYLYAVYTIWDMIQGLGHAYP